MAEVVKRRWGASVSANWFLGSQKSLAWVASSLAFLSALLPLPSLMNTHLYTEPMHTVCCMMGGGFAVGLWS